MLQVDDKVIVLKNDKKVLGMASVVDVCTDDKKLKSYFKEDHPNHSFYQFAIKNKEHIYIVNFENDLGQGGYLKKHLRKISN